MWGRKAPSSTRFSGSNKTFIENISNNSEEETDSKFILRSRVCEEQFDRDQIKREKGQLLDYEILPCDLGFKPLDLKEVQATRSIWQQAKLLDCVPFG